MKNYMKLFEEFFNPRNENTPCCDPLKLIDAFENHGGDDLRLAAYQIAEFGFESAEQMAEDPETAMSVRMLKSCISPGGVKIVPWLDFLEDMRFNLDDVRNMLYVLMEEGERGVANLQGGRDFLKRFYEITCDMPMMKIRR